MGWGHAHALGERQEASLCNVVGASRCGGGLCVVHWEWRRAERRWREVAAARATNNTTHTHVLVVAVLPSLPHSHTPPHNPPAPTPRNLRLLLRRWHLFLRLLPWQRRPDGGRRPLLLARGRLQRLPRLQRSGCSPLPRLQRHGAAGSLAGARVSERVKSGWFVGGGVAATHVLHLRRRPRHSPC